MKWLMCAGAGDSYHIRAIRSGDWRRALPPAPAEEAGHATQ